MVTLSSISIFLATALSALSAPLLPPEASVSDPRPSDITSTSVSSVASPQASIVSQPVLAASAPVTFGELTAPSQGGTFVDFATLPVGSTKNQATTKVSRFFRLKARGFLTDFFRDHDEFNTAGKGLSGGKGKGNGHSLGGGGAGGGGAGISQGSRGVGQGNGGVSEGVRRQNIALDNGAAGIAPDSVSGVGLV